MSYSEGKWQVTTGSFVGAGTFPNGTYGKSCLYDLTTKEQTASECHANCHLMEAAPDLLEACKAAYVTLIDDNHYQIFGNLIKTLENAIAKSEGRAWENTMHKCLKAEVKT